MEARHIEVATFARRAAEYKLAMELAPEARQLELAAVVAIVAGLVQQRGWHREQVQIVDLMAGNGELTRALHAAGFMRVVPLEACNEMHPLDSAQLGYMNGGAFLNLTGTLSQLRPQVIVSLAAFHHLIECIGGEPDRAASIAQQCAVIDDCINALVERGVLLIVDICECSSLAPMRIDPVNAWSATGMRLLSQLSPAEAATLTSSDSVVAYSDAIERAFGRVDKTCPVGWFRQVVQRESVIGHRDAAVSDPLLRVLKLRFGNRLRATLFACPWVFASLATARTFVLHKFGFLVNNVSAPDQTAIDNGLRKYLRAIPDTQGRVALHWGLAAITIEREVKPKEFHAIAVVNVVLIVAIALLGARIIARLAYSPDGVDDVLGNLFWLVLGIGAAVCGDSLKRRFVH
jgi:hypothetical protein